MPSVLRLTSNIRHYTAADSEINVKVYVSKSTKSVMVISIKKRCRLLVAKITLRETVEPFSGGWAAKGHTPLRLSLSFTRRIRITFLFLSIHRTQLVGDVIESASPSST